MLESNAIYLGDPPAPYGPLCAETVLSGRTGILPSPTGARPPMKPPLWE